jgi:hypothetical protein
MPEPTGTLINIGELAKPATVLIEKISDAIGVMFAPTQVRRMAKAEVDAALIKAAGDVQLTELQLRAFHRLQHEEERRQKNIEDITRLALPEVRGDAKPEQLEADWVVHFFDRARLISDPEMQTLWARLLAGEANNPGAFSRRTVDLVSTLDKDDARLFTLLCGFAWVLDGPVPLVFEPESDVYLAAGLNFDVLTHLDSIGVLRFDYLSGFIKKALPKVIELDYFGRGVRLELEADSDNRLEVGRVLLTWVGRQLAPISGATPKDQFFDFVCDHWEKGGLAVTKL